MIRRLSARVAAAPRDIRIFLAAVCLAGFGSTIFDSVFNNYLNETFAFTDLDRTLLEVPREMPGLLLVLVTALLFFLCSRRLAAASMLLDAAGLVLMALFASNVPTVVAALVVLSLGQHIFLPLSSSIGMELARDGQDGRRLGQLSGARNLAAIFGSFVVFLGFRFFGLSFRASFVLAAAAFAASALLLLHMTRGTTSAPRLRLKLHREYKLYYWLSILYGTRKQIFLTFGPWVLVRVFEQPTTIVATLLTVGGIIGIVFQPLLGRAIDRFGERAVLGGEAAALVLVCSAYAFSRALFPPAVALAVTGACYVIDQLLMSVGMARATYLKKIAVDPAHVTPTLTMAVSIDHVFSILTAVVSGFIWRAWGYRCVFLLAAAIAIVNLVSAARIRIPRGPAPRDAEVTAGAGAGV